MNKRNAITEGMTGGGKQDNVVFCYCAYGEGCVVVSVCSTCGADDVQDMLNC